MMDDNDIYSLIGLYLGLLWIQTSVFQGRYFKVQPLWQWKAIFFFLWGKLNYNILMKMKFVPWAALGLTLNLGGFHLQQGWWNALLWWHLSFIKETLLKVLFEGISWPPHLLTQEVQPLSSSTTLLPFPSAAALSCRCLLGSQLSCD